MRQEADAQDLPCAEHLESFCLSLSAERNASPHTIRAYRIDLEDFLRWTRRAKVDPLAATHRQLRRYLGELDRAQYQRTTVNRRLSSIRGFYRWLSVNGLIEEDPASVLQGPKIPKRLPKVIRPREMARLLGLYAAKDAQGSVREQSPEDMRNLAILEFLYACGARVSEASGLTLEGVDFAQGQVKVFGKGSKERIIPLHDMALSAMRTYLLLARPKLLKDGESDYFFVSTRGNQMSPDAIRKMFKESVRAAGLSEDLTPHDMRHTFATDLLSGGANLRSVQEMLGHASLSTTQIYTHVSVERLKSAHAQAHPRA
ncbi:MAG: tyrosine recombinase XerC [Eggerthellaceae bacterium]|nr:tyrosine recombinase XerC [Eggerthellaceae bacterium]